MHGGTVAVASEGEGRGTVFTVSLPHTVLHRGELASLHRVSPPELAHVLSGPPELAGLRILVVDDEDDSREMLRTLLEQSGLRVRVAASVAEALRLFEAEPAELLLSDLGMPDEDGYSLIAKLRALAGPGKTVPAIAVTAYARSEDRKRALDSGFHAHVAKPVEPVELLTLITTLSGRAATA